MTTPTGWVLTSPKTASFCPVEHALDAAAQTACCLRLPTPNRLQHSHYQISVSGLNWEVAENRAHVGIECIDPLASMFGISPTRLVCCNECISALIKRHSLRGIKARRGARALTCQDRINSLQP